MDILKKLALILVIIGAINWLLVGAFGFDLVALIFGTATNMLAKIVYIIIGICGFISVLYLIDDKRD